MSLITQANFVDLFLGPDFSDVKGLDGSGSRRESAPAAWSAELQALREQCQAKSIEFGDPEFSLVQDGIVLRVTQIKDAFSEDVFIIRKSNAQIRPFHMLGFPESLATAMLSDQVRGLVIFCGEMGTGKTSSVASLIAARLQACGGTALAIEDPAETNLNGLHGEGRCIQMQVSRRTGGYEEALLRALRTGADMILIGEIRDIPTAVQAVRAAINGVFVATTFHAGNPTQALERVLALASNEIKNAREILAQGLVAVVAQTLETRNDRRILKVRSLLVTGEDGASIREKIRAGQIAQLDQDIDNQLKRDLWG
ncbi:MULTISPECIES: ATPase, T2SS/T4P/T4SS family [Pseudomonas]|uniref:ATPase, T2SS/T4P/T4SS family n=1 Tax=Pseudomonadaceae TaxID=135621 RepID=UPI0004073051|nr:MULTISPECIES: ATPase, T2SS/T4P/T4SS family [Pseudomonas]